MGGSQSYCVPAVCQWYFYGVRSYGMTGYINAVSLFHEKNFPSMEGKVVAVTGATKGIGFATAEQFARLGAEVHLISRDSEACAQALAEIQKRTNNHKLFSQICDVSSKSKIKDFSNKFVKEVPILDILVNNAGCMPSKLTLTDDNNEIIMATAILGTYLMTSCMLPSLRASTSARVINVSSGGAYSVKARISDLNFSNISKYDGTLCYAFAKRNQIEITQIMADKLKDTRICVNSMHPGWVDTEGLRTAMPSFHKSYGGSLRTPEQGADTIVYLATSESSVVSGKSGVFWFDRQPVCEHMSWALGMTECSPEERIDLWQSVTTYCGQDFC